MPVAKLLVEGKLDNEILTPLLAGIVTVERGGSKNSLFPQARNERNNPQSRLDVRYLRDRDYDFEPPPDLARPSEDRMQGTTPIGWRWCRHAIESYLLDPQLITEATAIPQSQVEAELTRAADQIRWYQAARWSIGTARRILPPNYDFNTRPAGLNDVAIPDDLTEPGCRSWLDGHAAAFHVQVTTALNPSAIEASWNRFTTLFDPSLVSDPARILLWFSGKDLLAAMTPWIAAQGFANPGNFGEKLRDWARANPARLTSIFPEFAGLIELLRTP